MKRIATISPVWGCSVAELRDLASEAESGGFEAIFSPEVPPYSAIANAQVFAEVTSTIKVGTWITNIYMRQAVATTAEALTVQEVSEGRMVLGLGVSHKPVNDRYGIDMGNPIEKMREYVTAVKSFADGSSPLLTVKRQLPELPVYIAGLTRGAAELAGEVADGIMPYLATPEYMQKLKAYILDGANKAGRNASDIDVTNGIPSFISDDLEAARNAGKRGLSGYTRFPFYQRMIRNIGFGDVIDKIQDGTKPAEAFSDELLDAIALVGPPDRCRARLEDHRSAGVDLPIIVPGPVGKQSNIEVMKNTLETFSA
ncbi:LLM class flavin-dependent oxidoreductase [Desulfobacterota bacterium AH_259_B03_O07]|nr:LLM class flavin-dependent oxidoreductase [Desulfobacterota bacterium AH_259_B03_O07]